MIRRKKPSFTLRQPYSIRTELQTLNPFVRRDKIGAMKPYTIEEIQMVEHRLNFQLPEPIRDLYLVMGDYMCLQDEFYFRSLELLRWDGDYLLLVHGMSDNTGFGLYRNDAAATVYEWVCNDAITEAEEEHGEPSYYTLEGDFELCRHKGDDIGKQEAAKKFFDFWSAKANRTEVVKRSIHQNTHAKFTYFWDAFIMRFVIKRLIDDAAILDEARMTDELDQLYFSNDIPKQLVALNEVRKRITFPFVPISSHLELILDMDVKSFEEDFYHILAFVNKDDDCILVMHPDSQRCYLLMTKQLVPYSFAQKVEQQTGLLFCSRNGHGKDKVLALRREMRKQGLLTPPNLKSNKSFR